MNIVIPNRLKGRVRLTTKSKKRNQIKVHPWSHNLILDEGLELVANTNTYLDCCHVGRDNTPESGEQVSLLDFVGSTSNRTAANSVTTTEHPYFGISQITYEFPVGEITGIIRELGFGSSLLSNSQLFNRALVRDEFGEVSYTIVQPDEALQVEYELSLAAPIEDITGTVLHNGEEIGFTARPAQTLSTGHWCPYRAGSFATPGQAVRAIFDGTEPANHIFAFDSELGPEEFTPTGTGVAASWVRPINYVPGSHRSMVRAEWDIPVANFGTGIKSLLWFMRNPTGAGGNSLGAYQIEFDTPIMKTDQLSFYIDLGIQWSR